MRRAVASNRSYQPQSDSPGTEPPGTEPPTLELIERGSVAPSASFGAEAEADGAHLEPAAGPGTAEPAEELAGQLEPPAIPPGVIAPPLVQARGFTGHA